MKLWHKVLIVITALEVASFASFLNPSHVGMWVFGIASIIIIALTIRKLEYGVMLIFGELIVGSFGRELEVTVGGFSVSIRMVLWLVIMLVWIASSVRHKRVVFYYSKFFKPFAILAVVLGWGIAWGMIRGNGLGLIFSDVNNYLYFALIFPVYDVLRSTDARQRVGMVIATAIGYLATKTIVLFYIFSHELFELQDSLYSWSRHSHLAEITNVDPTVILSRVFMQSQIWLVFGFFIFLSVILERVRRGGRTIESSSLSAKMLSPRVQSSSMTISIILSIVSLAAIIASFSRSFWLAMIVTFVALVATMFAMREKLRTIGRLIAITAGTVVLGIGLVVVAMRFPIPQGNADTDLIANRAGKFTGEAAVSSRYAQIRPLLESIQLHPVLGSGFGTSVTYESQDPRVLQNHPDGLYTTTAFELGWLDMWLEIGLLGVGAYLYLLWRILVVGIKKARHAGGSVLATDSISVNSKQDSIASASTSTFQNDILLGAMAGLIAVALTHGISPYLNHPLGIGIVILMVSLIEQERSTS